MNIRNLIIAAMLGMSVAACTVPKNITYFQDLPGGQSMNVENPLEVKFKPDDKISILVSTTQSELNSLFSLYGSRNSDGSVSYSGGAGGGGNSYYRGSEYVIDSEGFIRFPVLGKIHVAGLSRQELQDYIRNEIIDRELVKDPIVTVNYEALYVTVLGSGAIGSGRVPIDKDNFTIIDALASKGDITIGGKRTNVKVIRENYGKKTAYEVNLCSAEDLYNSPVYYLQQNDIVYVEMTNMQKRNSTVFGNSILTPAFYISMASIIITVVNWFK